MPKQVTQHMPNFRVVRWTAKKRPNLKNAILLGHPIVTSGDEQLKSTTVGTFTGYLRKQIKCG